MDGGFCSAFQIEPVFPSWHPHAPLAAPRGKRAMLAKPCFESFSVASVRLSYGFVQVLTWSNVTGVQRVLQHFQSGDMQIRVDHSGGITY